MQVSRLLRSVGQPMPPTLLRPSAGARSGSGAAAEGPRTAVALRVLKKGAKNKIEAAEVRAARPRRA